MKAKLSSTTRMQVRDFKLTVTLGWPDQERIKKQTVSMDLDITFARAPSACQSDKLEDTFCYKQITEVIQEKIKHDSFFLIEHLSYRLYELIKPVLPKKAKLVVHITKKPNIKHLNGGVTFSYGD